MLQFRFASSFEVYHVRFVVALDAAIGGKCIGSVRFGGAFRKGFCILMVLKIRITELEAEALQMMAANFSEALGTTLTSITGRGTRYAEVYEPVSDHAFCSPVVPEATGHQLT